MPKTGGVSYKRTIYACYMGNISQAAIINAIPILFLTFRGQYGFSFALLGALVTVNFITQVITDLFFSRFVDKYGFRRFTVGGLLLMVVGLGLFAATPTLLPQHIYLGFVAGTILYSMGGGLMEILLSPIVNAIPSDEKAAAMSLLHSFYAWGQVAVVILTSLLVFVLPTHMWPLILVFWALVPLATALMFLKAPLAPAVPEHQRTKMSAIFKDRYFLMALVLIFCGAMTELSMSQWSSAFMESAVGLPKLLGDAAGMCMFGVMMGVGRAWYGVKGGRVSIRRVMVLCCLLGIVCYLTVAISTLPVLSLVACALCGLAASLLWPGSIVLTAHRFPHAGAVMFAIMAAGGDIGASVGPSMVGLVAEVAHTWPFLATLTARMGADQVGLRAGMFVAALFPLGALLALLYLGRKGKERVELS